MQKVWCLLPALALSLSLGSLLLMRGVPRRSSRLAGAARDLYEIMFWVTPTIGIAVLMSMLIFNLPRRAGDRGRKARRELWLAGAAIASPVWLLLLQILLSGFSR
ncbi:MAG: hypothetical protein M3430_03425 [Acidobacteriota bacterium]|nr:hypothetical protein [Acidobacteriota bacterium]